MPITLLRASAGSGKTFRLVQEYLRIVLKHPDDFKHVLAITFTKKATKEMKERILDNLKALATENASAKNMLVELKKDPDLARLKDIPQRARRVLEAILQNYSYFSVSTIDAFFIRMLTGIIRELKEPVEFSVDLDEDSIFDETKRILYRNIKPKSPLLLWLSEYAMSLIQDDKGWNIDRGINELGKEIFREEFDAITDGFELDDKVVRKLISDNFKARKVFENEIAKRCRAFRAIIDQFEIKDDLASNSTTFVGHLENKTYGTPTIVAFFKKIEKGVWGKPTMNGNVELTACALDLHTYFEQHHPDYQANKSISRNLHMRGIYDYLSSALKELRDEEKVLLLFDVKRVLKKAIQKGDLPLVYEKMGLRYKYFFLDEFQDTSDYQYLVMKPFLDNAAASAEDHAFIVGDVKQSIYRFRGANVNLMAKKLEEDFKLTIESLENNYRSRPEIVSFNNAFFKNLISRLDNNLLNLGYEALAQKVDMKHEVDGYVHIEIYDKKIKNFEYLKNRVDEIIEDGYAFSDIMILVNTWNDASAISSYFLSQGTKYQTESRRSLLIGTSKINALLITALQYLLNANNLVAAKSMSSYYHDIHKLSMPQEAATKQDDFVERLNIPGEFEVNRERLCRLPVYEIVMEILKMFSLESMMDDMVYRFLDYLLELSEEGTNSLLDVLAWWDLNKDNKYLTTSGSDAMQITTIHSAKGLESPVVIMPKCNFVFTKFGNHWSSILPAELQKEFGGLQLQMSTKLADGPLDDAFRDERDKQFVDGINKLYVAFTRAMDRLYIFMDTTKDKPSEIANARHAVELVVPDIQGGGALDHIGDVVVFGRRQIKAQSEVTEHLASVNLPHIPSATKPQVELSGQSRKFFSLFDNAKSLPIQLGLEIHALLENLSAFDDFESTLDLLIQNGSIRSNHRTEILKLGQQLSENEIVQQWFLPKWEVRNESAIFSKGEMFKPDRVMINGGQAIVVDYKSGEESDKHIEQLNNYGDLLTQLGYEQIEKYILYTRDMKVIAV